ARAVRCRPAPGLHARRPPRRHAPRTRHRAMARAPRPAPRHPPPVARGIATTRDGSGPRAVTRGVEPCHARGEILRLTRGFPRRPRAAKSYGSRDGRRASCSFSGFTRIAGGPSFTRAPSAGTAARAGVTTVVFGAAITRFPFAPAVL